MAWCTNLHDFQTDGNESGPGVWYAVASRGSRFEVFVGTLTKGGSVGCQGEDRAVFVQPSWTSWGQVFPFPLRGWDGNGRGEEYKKDRIVRRVGEC